MPMYAVTRQHRLATPDDGSPTAPAVLPNPETLTRFLAGDPELYQQVIDLVDKQAPEAFYVPAERAREIMSPNICGAQEVMDRFAVKIKADILERLLIVPLPLAVLESCRDSHVLVVGYPFTLLDLREREPDLFSDQEWFLPEFFARQTRVRWGWSLQSRGPAPGSAGKSVGEQERLLSTSWEVSPACEVVYAAILHFLVTGRPLSSQSCARCSDFDSEGNRVQVEFKGRKLHLYSSPHDWDRRPSLGLATTRQS